jgi:hypothetical protein
MRRSVVVEERSVREECEKKRNGGLEEGRN